jgi:hypothetical protein
MPRILFQCGKLDLGLGQGKNHSEIREEPNFEL